MLLESTSDSGVENRGLVKQYAALTELEKQQVDAVYEERDRLNKQAGYIAFCVDHIILYQRVDRLPDNLQILSAEENLKKRIKIISASTRRRRSD